VTAATVVVDASAGVELVVNTARGRALRQLIPRGAVLAVPEHFFAEVAGVLRRWEGSRALTSTVASEAVRRLAEWQLHRAQLAVLLEDAWVYRHNMSIADALYVVLPDRLSASLLTDDHRLTNAPSFPRSVPVLRLAVQP
jgi:predicted nucleic acid-binding protein